MGTSFDTLILVYAVKLASCDGGVVRPKDVERELEGNNFNVSRYAVRKAFRGFAADGIFVLTGNKYVYNVENRLYFAMVDAFRAVRDA